jgi:uncharacterized membrane protein
MTVHKKQHKRYLLLRSKTRKFQKARVRKNERNYFPKRNSQNQRNTKTRSVSVYK